MARQRTPLERAIAKRVWERKRANESLEQIAKSMGLPLELARRYNTLEQTLYLQRKNKQEQKQRAMTLQELEEGEDVPPLDEFADLFKVPVALERHVKNFFDQHGHYPNFVPKAVQPPKPQHEQFEPWQLSAHSIGPDLSKAPRHDYYE